MTTEKTRSEKEKQEKEGKETKHERLIGKEEKNNIPH
jgi:hypothetical protein